MLPAPLKESDFLKTFVLLMVCSVTGGALAGGVLGAIVGVICAALRTPQTIRVLAPVVGGIAGILITYVLFRAFVLRFIVRKIVTGPPIEASNAV